MYRSLLLFALLLLLPAKSVGQIFQLPFPTQENLRAVAFCNPDTGFVVSALSIYRTTDGGSSWAVVANAPPPHQLADISVPKFSPTKQTVYAVGGYMFFDFANQTQDVGNLILKSTDFGATWQTTLDAQDIGESQLDYVYALTDSVAFVMGSQGPFISNNNFKKTTNGGMTWFALNGLSSQVYGGSTLDFLNTSIGYANGHFGGILKSNNEGNDWTFLTLLNALNVSFLNEQIGYAGSVIVYKTSSFGNSWTPLDTVLYGSDMEFASDSVGYLVADTGRIFKFKKSNEKFLRLVTPISNDLHHLSLVSSTTIYVVGSGGVVLKTTNGGTSVVRESSTEKPALFRLSQNYPNPFNPTTTIRYDLPTPSFVKLDIFDLLGRRVAILVNERKDAGAYEARFNAANLASGVYFYRLEANPISGSAIGGFVETKKMLLLK